MADLDRINELIEQSSLGTPEARDLRRRTSRAEARRLVTAAERRDAVELQREPAHQERRAPLRDRDLALDQLLRVIEMEAESRFAAALSPHWAAARNSPPPAKHF